MGGRGKEEKLQGLFLCGSGIKFHKDGCQACDGVGHVSSTFNQPRGLTGVTVGASQVLGQQDLPSA